MNLTNFKLYPAAWKLMPSNTGRMTAVGRAAYQTWLSRERAETDILRARGASGDEYMELTKRQRARDEGEIDDAREAESAELYQRTAAIEVVRRSPEMKAVAAKARAEASAILTVCDNAGKPELVKGFIEKDMSIDQVRSTLLGLRAEKSEREEVVSHHIDNSSEAHTSAADNYGWDRAFARAAGQCAI